MKDHIAQAEENLSYSQQIKSLKDSYRLKNGRIITAAIMVEIFDAGWDCVSKDTHKRYNLPTVYRINTWFVDPTKPSHRACKKEDFDVFTQGMAVWKNEGKIVSREE